jgi:hypothetical protein
MREIALGIAALLALSSCGCGTSASDVAHSDKTKQAILRVLGQDQQLAKKRKTLPPKSTPTQIAWGVGQYCDELDRLDMSDCPADFRVAYTQHIRAWREAESAIQRLPDSFLQGVLMGAMNSILRGETDGGQSRLEGELKHALERVRMTWEEVERVGAKYGAAL